MKKLNILIDHTPRVCIKKDTQILRSSRFDSSAIRKRLCRDKIHIWWNTHFYLLILDNYNIERRKIFKFRVFDSLQYRRFRLYEMIICRITYPLQCCHHFSSKLRLLAHQPVFSSSSNRLLSYESTKNIVTAWQIHSTKNRPLVKPEYACIEDEDRVDSTFTRFFFFVSTFSYFLEIGNWIVDYVRYVEIHKIIGKTIG